MTVEYRTSEIDYQRADRFRVSALMYGAISAACVGIGVAQIAAGNALFALPAFALGIAAAMGGYGALLSRAVVLTGGAMGGFAAVKWLGGVRAVLFSRQVPEIYPPTRN